MQAQLISHALELSAGVRLTNFALVFVEKKPPFEVAVREITPADMDEAAKDNRAALRAFAIGLEKGRWPGKGGGMQDAKFLSRSNFNRDLASNRRAQLERNIFG